MKYDLLYIDDTTLVDDVNAKKVSFQGELEWDLYSFSISYSRLEFLSNREIDGNAVEIFDSVIESIKFLAFISLPRPNCTKITEII